MTFRPSSPRGRSVYTIVVDDEMRALMHTLMERERAKCDDRRPTVASIIRALVRREAKAVA